MVKTLRDYGTDPDYDRLVIHDDPSIRLAPAEDGYGLSMLWNDIDPRVRKAVAENGYGLDKLINDKDTEVKAAAKEFLELNGYETIDEWKRDNLKYCVEK